MERIHNELKKEDDIFKYYKCLGGENIINNKEKAKKYEEELIQLIKDKANVKSLKEFINKLENTNPFSNGYVERKNYEDQIEDRLTLKNQDKVKNTFNYIIDGKKGNSLETMIQRHIMLSNEYVDILGKPLFYEFPCDRGKVPIDLITYDEKNKILYLIELKKCSGKITQKRENLSESNELFLRALLEITTYYTFFKHLLITQKKEIEKALSTVGGIDFKFDDVKEIRKAVLAPKIVFDTVYTDELKEELSKIDCFTIATLDDISNTKINTKDKVFEIKRYEQS